MEFISKSLVQTQKIGSDFAKKLVLGTLRKAVVIGLFGDLGSGKTTFVQGMAKGLGIRSDHYVNSPTFTLVNEYDRLIHVDLYRLEKPEEVQTLGLTDYLESPHILVVEWAEKWDTAYDARVHFEVISDRERRITIDGL